MAAFEVLIDRYKDLVYTACTRITRNGEDTEEVAQDTFLKPYQHLEQFKGESKFSTWLYTIAYHTAISRIRKKQIPTADIAEEVLENVESSATMGQLQVLQEKDRQFYVRAAIDKLEADEAALLTFHYLQELSIREIALVTELTESNVKVKLFRARKRLHVILQRMLQGEIEEMATGK